MMVKLKDWNKKNHVIPVAIFFAFVFLFSYLRYFSYPGRVMVASVSTDGHYAITTDDNGFAILWDLKNHREHILSRKANVYSAYFIKQSHLYMWQDFSDNMVHVQNVNGREIKSFCNFPVYGQVMYSDLETYVASESNWTLFKGVGKAQELMMIDSGGFWGQGKLFNLTLSNDGRYLLTSGNCYGRGKIPPMNPKASLYNYQGFYLEGVVLWDIRKGIPIRKFPGCQMKVYATISPDNKYIVGTDEDTFSYVWDLNTGKKLVKLNVPSYGDYVCKNVNHIYSCSIENKPMSSFPDDFWVNVEFAGTSLEYSQSKPGGMKGYAFVSVKFIDKSHYLRFPTYLAYAALFNVTRPKPIKYLPLGINPPPSTDGYDRDQSIDTSPQAHVLVTGKTYDGGIIVYQYDPKTQTLKRTWASKSILGYVNHIEHATFDFILRYLVHVASFS